MYGNTVGACTPTRAATLACIGSMQLFFLHPFVQKSPEETCQVTVQVFEKMAKLFPQAAMPDGSAQTPQ